MKTKGASDTHTKSHHSFSHLQPTSPEGTRTRSFSVRVLPVESTEAIFPKSPQVRFLIVWLSLYYFPIHQPAVTNSMHFVHLHPTLTAPPIRDAFGVQPSICGGTFFCKNSQLVKAVGCFRGGAPSWALDRVLNAKGQTRVTNSQTVTHESWLVRCSPRAPGFSRSN